MKDAILIYNAHLVDENLDDDGAVLSADGKIVSVFLGDYSEREKSFSAAKSVLPPKTEISVFNAEGLVLSPAFIDTHVHLRDPGQTQKEDLLSGLTACVHGGYGTVVAMPNTNPVISSAEQAREVMRRGNSLGLANLVQSISITDGFGGKDTSHLENLPRLEFPVITEDGHDVLSSSVMLDGMKKAGKNGQIVSCHCEDCSLAEKARPHREKALEIMRRFGLSAWGKGDTGKVPCDAMREIDSELSEANDILALAEDSATERNIRIAEKAGCHIHICHISTENSVEAVRRAKKNLDAEKNISVLDGFSVTAEATPHHIALTGDSEPLIRALVNPPLRHENDRISLINALRDGTVDCIATDHAPHTAEDKANGSPGFSGIETAYGICNTVLVKGGKLSASRLNSLMSANPARILHLDKGLFKVGFDADFTLLNPDEKWTVEPSEFFSKGKATPFDGAELFGKVKGLFVSEKKIF